MSELQGRWVPVVIEWPPVPPGASDGGFSDLGKGDLMSAEEIGLDADWLELHDDGAFSGSLWGFPESGTWNETENGVLLSQGDGPALDFVNGRLVRPGYDEEHGRRYLIHYEQVEDER